jgi:hypothetical protein
MRTTLTLDEDVAIILKRIQEKERMSFKKLVNEVLRQGLRQMTTPGRPSKRRRTRAVDLGRCLFGSGDDVAEILAVVEGEAFR